MKICWVIADQAYLDPTVDISQLKNIGPFWGGWRTWRSWNTDNVVCYRSDEAAHLVEKNFHTKCNLYLPATTAEHIQIPPGVRLYQGSFHQEVDQPDEIVSMHLASAHNDIVLLYGFDLRPKNFNEGEAKLKWHNFKNYVKHIFVGNTNVQWVILDHSPDLESELQGIDNIQFDTVANIVAQFGNK